MRRKFVMPLYLINFFKVIISSFHEIPKLKLSKKKIRKAP